MVQTHRASTIGAAAKAVLATGTEGRILASLSGAVFLQCVSGELAWLVPESAGMHRRALRLRGPLPAVERGEPYSIRRQSIVVDSRNAIDFRDARGWSARRQRHATRLRLDRLRARMQEAGACLRDLPGPRGFGVFLPTIEAVTAGEPFVAPEGPHPSAVQLAVPAVAGLANACTNGDLAALLCHAEALIGLGDGLTPSGDDLVGGLLFGLGELRTHSRRRPLSRLPAVRAAIGRWHGLTHPISHTLLADHAAGHASEELHWIARVLLTDAAPKGFHRWALPLVSLGHSSGWEWLTGLWMAFGLVAPRSRLLTHT